MGELDAGAITERKDVLLADVGGAVVVEASFEVGGHLEGGAPGAGRNVRGLVPVGVGPPPHQRAIVLILDEHLPVGQIAWICQAGGSLRE